MPTHFLPRRLTFWQTMCRHLFGIPMTRDGRGHALAISSIVLFELRYGAAKSARPQRNTQRIADFLSGPIEVLPFEPADADEAGDIRAALERAGTPIGPYDVLVAAQARQRDALLVTANTSEFARVPRLKLEDWGMPE